MLMLLGLVLPLAVLGFAIGGDDDDDEETLSLEGSEGADRLEGGLGDDFIDGEAGDDVLNGRAGDDTIFGRDGDDVLEGADGADMLCSGDGDDVVTGNRGQDTLEGQGGDDFVSGDYSQDSVFGNEGNDTVIGGRGTDLVNGGEGDDLVFGGILEGVPLNLEEMTQLRDGGSLEEINSGLEIRDDRFGNTLFGGQGNDDLVLGSGDVADGNAGADTYHVMSEQVGDLGPATISSYVQDVDAITIIVDDVEADAEITVTDDGENAVIRFAGNVVAVVQGAAGTLEAADISLISEELVESLFDPNSAAA